ncbi:unnamed protein product [Ambrosiozyma monospora]|uniref:Unnamed protein product n=1 Tax=Ambrosiozyma monospora TaxID=43982 RepID=A0A9W6WL90_AMBMO|nr:unnamed protein product [Ambrosiozyma monospora]
MQVYYHHFHVLYRSAPDSVSSATTTTPTSPETDKFVTATSLGTALTSNEIATGYTSRKSRCSIYSNFHLPTSNFQSPLPLHHQPISKIKLSPKSDPHAVHDQNRSTVPQAITITITIRQIPKPWMLEQRTTMLMIDPIR